MILGNPVLRTLAIAIALGTAVSAGSHASDTERRNFAPHRAVFDLTTLPSAKSKSFTGVTGRFVYDYNRTCFGETYNHRMKMRLTAVSGQSIETESRVSAFEPSDGLSMQFTLREWLNGHSLTHFAGMATRDRAGASARVDYEKIEGATEAPPTELSGKTLFPMQHSTHLLNSAAAGKKLVSTRVFDGDSVSIVDAIIARPGPDIPPAVTDRMRADFQPRKLLLSFFDPDKPDASPHYQSRMVLWTNGVTSSFTMETEDISVMAVLTELEFTAPPDCN